MIKHIVFMKFPQDVEKNTQDVKSRLLKMQGKINSLVSIEVGIDFDRSERAYDLALVTEFASKNDLKSYAINPVHQEVIRYIKSLNTLTKVVDYEI